MGVARGGEKDGGGMGKKQEGEQGVSGICPRGKRNCTAHASDPSPGVQKTSLQKGSAQNPLKPK